MTIIEPKKNKFKINITIIGLFFFLFAIAYWNVLIYNQTVDLRHAVNDATNQAEELGVANADLKNQLYQLIDPKNLTALGEERGLVKIKSPHYIEVSEQSWSVVSASQL